MLFHALDNFGRPKKNQLSPAKGDKMPNVFCEIWCFTVNFVFSDCENFSAAEALGIVNNNLAHLNLHKQAQWCNRLGVIVRQST